jgi:hypothetical protein
MLSELVGHWLEEAAAACSASESDAEDSSAAARVARAAKAAGRGPRAVLLYSARAPEEFALMRRLLALQDASGGALQIRLLCSTYRSPPGGRLGGLEGADDGAAAAAAAAAEPRRPPPVLLTSGVRSLARRRLLPQDLRAAVADLLGASAAAGGANEVTAYVCGPPALADSVVAELESGVEGVGEVVMERWW